VRVAVSASGPSLDSNVDPRFGRCPCFVIVDTETGEHEVLDNASVAASQGAGIATAQMIAGKQVSAVLTGNCGPNAYQALSAAGIDVISGVSGTVSDAVAAFKAGRYRPSPKANVAAHHGLGGGAGGGMSMGAGAGAGTGMGTGMGRFAPPESESGMMQVLRELKVQLDDLRSRVDDVNRRIDELHSRD